MHARIDTDRCVRTYQRANVLSRAWNLANEMRCKKCEDWKLQGWYVFVI